MRPIEFCAEECERQQVSPMHVWYMYQAWEKVSEPTWKLTVDNVIELGCIIEPNKVSGLRQVQVQIGNDIPMSWRLVPAALRGIILHGEDLTPEEFYSHFEIIHPFEDGNGRVGALLYNFRRGGGNILWPTTPPDLFSSE